MLGGVVLTSLACFAVAVPDTAVAAVNQPERPAPLAVGAHSLHTTPSEVADTALRATVNPPVVHPGQTGSHPPASRAAAKPRLAVTIRGLEGFDAAVTVRGPKKRGVKQLKLRLTSTRTIKNLRPGKYTITAARVELYDGYATPTRRVTTTTVKKRRTRRVTVTYRRTIYPPDAGRDCSIVPGNYLNGCNLSGVDLSGRDLSGVDLDGADLRGANLTGVTLPWRLQNANLAGANFSNTDLKDTTLSGCNLTGANLTGAHIGSVQGGEFSNVTITGAHLANAYLTGVNTSGGITGTPASQGASATMHGQFLIGQHPNFHHANLTGMDFTGIDLRNSTIINSTITGARFAGTTLGENPVNWYGSWSEAGIEASALTGTPATLPAGWRLANGRLLGPGATVRGGTWGYLYNGVFGLLDTRPAANLTGLNLAGADLSHSMLSHIWRNGNSPVCEQVDTPGDGAIPNAGCGVDFTNTTLTNANLTGSVLSAGRLVNTDLRGVNLTNAILSNSYIQGIDLRGATLTGIQAYGLTGTPAHLPTGWTIIDGHLTNG